MLVIICCDPHNLHCCYYHHHYYRRRLLLLHRLTTRKTRRVKQETVCYSEQLSKRLRKTVNRDLRGGARRGQDAAIPQGGYDLSCN